MIKQCEWCCESFYPREAANRFCCAECRHHWVGRSTAQCTRVLSTTAKDERPWPIKPTRFGKSQSMKLSLRPEADLQLSNERRSTAQNQLSQHHPDLRRLGEPGQKGLMSMASQLTSCLT